MKKINKEKDSLQITDAVYYVLLALQKPLHGYVVMQEVERLSNGLVKLGPATLYTVLSRLQEEELIKTLEVQVGEDARRKPYEITTYGKERLLSEIKKRYQMAMHGIRSLGLKESELVDEEVKG